MRAEPVAYQDLIESLADGARVDWAALEAGARTDAERRRYRNLRLVARIVELHRTLALEEEHVESTQPEPPPLPSPPMAWGHLQVIERLASGAFGDLYRARDPQLDRVVALKLLRPRPAGDASISRLLSEAQTLARVSHPNVVVVHGADVRDGRAGLWMELIEGQTLESVLHERGRFGAGEAISIGRDVCRALAAVHGAGLVHSDVKAQNVMRESGGRIVLMDFGAGRAQGTSASVAGTPLYFAPEVLAGAPPTPQSDVYSLGVLLFYLLTQSYPCLADDLETLRRVHADGPRAHLRDLRPGLPDALVDCVERALEADPAMRFATAGAMERALAKAQGIDDSWWRAFLAPMLLTAAVLAAIGIAWPRFGTRGPVQSLAVLPFTPPNSENAYLTDGLTTDVVRELQRFDVQVRRATGVAAGSSNGDLDSRLGADVILAADARREGVTTRLRVTVRRAATAPFWIEDYDVEDSRLPSIARTIAQGVAEAIGARVRAGAPAPSHQTNYRAYDAYHHGRVLSEQRNPTALTRSLEYFTEASKLDPAYAEPWAGMADTFIALGVPPFGDLRPMEARRRAKAAALKALDLNPNLAEAHTSLAWGAALYDWDWPAAEARFAHAIRLNPQYALAHHWYAMFLTDMGRFDEARTELQQAQALEPLSLLIHRDFGWIDFYAGQYDAAIAQLRETLTRDRQYSTAITLLARALAAKGQSTAGLAELERARPDLTPASYLSFRGYIEAAGGDPRARETLAELRVEAEREYVTPYYFALIHAALGDRENAIAELQRAHGEQDSTLGSVNVDPRFSSIRSDPRFQALIAAMRFPAPPR